MTDETTQALLPVTADFSRATLQTNIESILRNSRDVHTHSLTLMIMDAIPRAAPHSESDVVAALQALFDNYKELADSGDAGFWSLEDTPVGKQALAALENARHRLAHSLPSQADETSGEEMRLREGRKVSSDAFGLTDDEAWEQLINFDDRTSPAEYPDMALITREELSHFMRSSAVCELTDYLPGDDGEE